MIVLRAETRSNHYNTGVNARVSKPYLTCSSRFAP
jgi:hypothetical protein